MKRVLLVFMAMLVLGSLNAQEGNKAPVKKNGLEFGFGPKVGFNWTSISTYNKNKCDFSAGVFADVRFNRYIGAQIEALYSRQGTRHKENGTKWYFKYDYVNIPILAKVYIFKRFSFDLGPQFGFLINDKVKWKTTPLKGTDERYSDIMKNFDFSLALGFSYDFKFGLVASARYNIGLTQVMEKHNILVDGSNYNRVFQFSLGWKF
ncbi:MAG: porin family protein [Marinifilaceae bacterium]|nr:porin family protein [Marinifilaceae bacterium]